MNDSKNIMDLASQGLAEYKFYRNSEQPESKGQESKESQSKNQSSQGNSSVSHEGKYFIIPKGKAQCNQGLSFPNFKVTSHSKHHWNGEGEEYLAVTEEDTQFTPTSQPFGAQCKLQPNGSGYLPCSYSPAGKWQTTYEKVKVLNKSCLTELSELSCVIGGKITVKSHGQSPQMNKKNLQSMPPNHHQNLNPLLSLENFIEEIEEPNLDAY